MEIQPQPQIFDVDEQNFEELVIQGSLERVIVVDFWAPWCGPCKTLGPILEDVVAALGPGVALAKINVDENQQLATAFRVQGIPAVKIVKDGQLAQEFTGALPREQIEAILRPLVSDAPIPEAQVIDQADDLAAIGDFDAAARQYENVLEENPTDGPALLGLAKIHLQQGRFETVQELVNLVEADAPEHPQAQALLTQIRVCPPVPAGWGPRRLRPADTRSARRLRDPLPIGLLRGLRRRLRNRVAGMATGRGGKIARRPSQGRHGRRLPSTRPRQSASGRLPAQALPNPVLRTPCKLPASNAPSVACPSSRASCLRPSTTNPHRAIPSRSRRGVKDVLRIHTDQGLTGLGMSGPYYGDREEQPPDLIGKDPNTFEPRTLRGGGWNIALLDLIGKTIDWPLCRIFGGKLQDKVLVDYWISRMSTTDTARAAQRAAELGFHGIKMKCKWEDANMEDRVRASLEVAPHLRIVLDFNERLYNLNNALDLARRLDGLDVVLEDPLPKTDLNEYRRLKGETSVLVAPHFQNPRQIIDAVHLEAVDAFNVAPSDWDFLDMARIAASEDIPVWQASNVDLGIFDAFRLHASAAAPNCTFGSDLCGNFVHEHSLLKEPLVQDGYAIVPTGPGLGVELDEEAVARYAISAQQWPG